jgi:hypothetical protein
VNRNSLLVLQWEKPQHFKSSLPSSSELSFGGSDVAPLARRTSMADNIHCNVERGCLLNRPHLK